MTKVCKNCGRAANDEDRFCMDCGTPLEKETAQWEEMKSAENEHKEQESVQEEKVSNVNEKTLSMWDYLLMLILMAIPVVNFIVCIVWVCSGNVNLNRKNFAKAWIILAVISTIFNGILFFGLFQFLVMDHTTFDLWHIEFSFPEKEFIDSFLGNLKEI